jgi:hypothetical protein
VTTINTTPLAAAKTPEGAIADAILAAVDSPAGQSAVIGAINAMEGGVTAFLATAVNNFKPTGAILPLVWNALKPAVLTELAAIESANPGSVIFALLDADAHALAKSVGG